MNKRNSALQTVTGENPAFQYYQMALTFSLKQPNHKNSKRAIKTVMTTRLFLKLRNLLKELLCPVTTLPTTSRPSAYHS